MELLGILILKILHEIFINNDYLLFIIYLKY